jgi:signal transduction histidine kinase
VRTALSPLRDVERAARSVADGDLGARAPVSPMADRGLHQLVSVFNGMVDALAAEHRQERRLTLRLLGAEEEERQRISRELLGDTAQVLSALLLRVRLLERELAGDGRMDGAALEAALEAVREGVLEALNGVRRIGRDLRPPELEEVGLTAALKAYARALRETSGLSVVVEGEEIDPEALPLETALASYRVLQEAISNVRRHAGVQAARLRVGREGGRLVAELEDEGFGFEADRILRDPAGHMGLHWMRRRAFLAGGGLQVETGPGRGTRIRLEVPLGPTENGDTGPAPSLRA